MHNTKIVVQGWTLCVGCG